MAYNISMNKESQPAKTFAGATDQSKKLGYAIIAVIITVSIAIAVVNHNIKKAHQQALTACQSAVSSFDQAKKQDQLDKLDIKGADKITTDEVTDPQTVTDFADAYSDAKQEISRIQNVTVYRCQDSDNNDQLNATARDAKSNTAKVDQAIARLNTAADAIVKSRGDKEIESAKAGYEATKLKAQELLNRAAAKLPPSVRDGFNSTIDTISDKAKSFDSAKAYVDAKGALQSIIDSLSR